MKKAKSKAKVIARVPRNKFDPKLWPSRDKYFRNIITQTDEDGHTKTELFQADYPMYKPGSFCEERLHKTMGLRPEDNVIALAGGSPYYHWNQIFESDDQDNIDILVYTLDRELIPLKKTGGTTRIEDFGGNGKMAGVYQVKRLNSNNIREGQGKYVFPSHDQSEITYPFIPPQLVEKWENNEHIETLVLTEGYFKAMKACMLNFFCRRSGV